MVYQKVGAIAVAAFLLAACSDNKQNAADAEAQKAATRQAEIAALEARADRIEDANDIKRLQRAYGYYLDKGLWDDLADLFAADATAEYDLEGVYVGQDRIRAFLRKLGND